MATKAVILVGGPTKGTRFRPISLSQHFVPKPLFPIAGRPMILHHIEACVAIPTIKEILLLGFYDEALFADFLETQTKNLGVKIQFLRETQTSQFGTAGSLDFFKEKILEGNPQNILVVNCDICSDFPFGSLLSFHQEHKGQISVVAKKVPSDQSQSYGCIAVDKETKEMIHYAEKPESFVSDLINCGIYCLSPAFFETLKQIKGNRESEGAFRLEYDIFPEISGRQLCYVHETTGYWSAIKSVGMAVVCSQFYMDKYKTTHPELLFGNDKHPIHSGPKPTIVGTVLLHPSSQVHPTAKLGPNVFISAGAKIGPGVRIANSIILDNAEIKERSCILYSVIGWNSVIGKWARIEGINDPKANSTTDSNNIGVSIIGEGVTIDNEVMVRRCVVLPHKEITTTYSNQIIL